MLHSRTEPSTPLRNVVSVDQDPSNHSAPMRSRISGIHLPPQDLADVIHGMSLRLEHERSHHGLRRNSRGASAHTSRPQSRSHSRPGSRAHTPTRRRLSDHLTVRRRRRSSTGMVYESAYGGQVSKGFLRAFSRALLREQQKQSPEEVDEEVYRALDKQHRLQSTSPSDHPNEFDHSLPLPADDVMKSPEFVRTQLKKQPAPQKDKPVFKSYLERILEARSKPSANPFHSIFDRDFSDLSRQDSLNAVISTSKFVIENTLSGLSEYDQSLTANPSDLRLAEPVAFGNLSDQSSSNESSDKENIVAEPQRPREDRSSIIDFGNRTPTHFEYQYDEINEVPQWELVPYMPEELVTPVRDLETFAPPQIEFDNDIDDLGENADIDLPQSGLILGHFTIDNTDIQPNEDLQAHLDEAVIHKEPLEPRSISTIRPQMAIANKRANVPGNVPRSLMKGFVSLARHIPSLSQSPPKKKRRSALNTDLMRLITAKSNEFISQVMLDLSAYATHRDSDQIDISDAVLFLDRIRTNEPDAEEVDHLSILAQSIFPLEALVSLDNSLQELATKKRRQRRHLLTATSPTNNSYVEPAEMRSTSSEEMDIDDDSDESFTEEPN